jgi:hypothetical protein
VLFRLPFGAAKRGKLEILIFLNQNPDGFPWSSKIPDLAASRGHVNILNYNFENKILEIHFSKIFFLAAKGAKSVPYNERGLQVLKWVKKKGIMGTLSGDLVVPLDRPDHKLLRWVLIHGFISEEGKKSSEKRCWEIGV